MVRLLILCLLVLMGVAAPAAAQTGSRHAAPDLEALLPTSLGGVALTVESQIGTDLTTSSVAFDAFLASLGKTRADFSLASAYARKGLPAAVGAWRVKGADPAPLLPGFKVALQASSATPLASAEESSRAARSRASATRASSPKARSTHSCVATRSGSCRRPSQRSRRKRWASCRDRQGYQSSACFNICRNKGLSGLSQSGHSSALTMKPASTSSVAEVT